MTHLAIWSCLSICIRAVGTWWWGLRGRASTTIFSSVFPLSSRVGGLVDHHFDQFFKDLKLDEAPPWRKAWVFLLFGCWRSGCHGCRAEKKQSKGKWRWKRRRRRRRIRRGDYERSKKILTERWGEGDEMKKSEQRFGKGKQARLVEKQRRSRASSSWNKGKWYNWEGWGKV